MQATGLTIAGQTKTDPLPHTPGRAGSLYIHIPFCFHKCHYCDFYSIVDSQDRQPAFVDALIRDLERLAPHAAALRTVFVGGGTPTLLASALWQRLLREIHQIFLLEHNAEFTVECNPETASAELFDVLVAGGVNRISIGAQSFNPAHLKTLERWHDPASVPRALELAVVAGIPRRSIDLISAIPGQTLDEWLDDLDRALSLPIDHLSAYSLTYEPGTAMTARLERGRFEPTDESLEADMFLATVERARSAGFERYEVSNFARPGSECRHNLAYWRQHDWLAAGPSASGHLAGARWKNAPNLRDYLAGMDELGRPPLAEYEAPDPRRALAERLMTGLRLSEGLDAHEMLDRAAALGRRDQLEQSAQRLERKHLISTHAGTWRLTDDGWLMADSAAAELMAALG